MAINKTLILLTTEKENWVPQELEKVAKAKGFNVLTVNPDTCFISLAPEPFIAHEGKKFEGADIVIPRLSEDNLDYKCAIINHLEKMDIKVLNTGKSMRIASNKVETQILLNDVGLSTPKTAVFTNEEQIDAALEAIGGEFPVIVKTLFGTHGVGVVRADSKASLVSLIQLLLKSGEQFMLQEFIEHSESARVLLLDDKVLASVMRTIPDGDFRSNAHQGAELKKHEPTQEELDACIKAAKTLGIRLAAVDYILNGDDIVILEVNGSPGFEAMQKVIDEPIADAIIDFCLEQVGGEGDEKEEEVEPTPSIEEEEPKEEDEKEDEKEVEVVEVPPHDVEGDKIVGSLTKVIIKHFNNEEPIEARVDTGASISSIHGDNIEVDDTTIKFTFGKTRYKFHLARTSKIKQSSIDDPDERPVIRVDMVIDGITLRNVELSVTDREHMEYNILLGRKTLASGGFLVNPAAGVLDNVSQEDEQEHQEEPVSPEEEQPSGNEEE